MWRHIARVPCVYSGWRNCWLLLVAAVVVVVVGLCVDTREVRFRGAYLWCILTLLRCLVLLLLTLTYLLYLLLVVRTTVSTAPPTTRLLYVAPRSSKKARPLFVASMSLTGRRKHAQETYTSIRTTSNTAGAVVPGCPCFNLLTKFCNAAIPYFSARKYGRSVLLFVHHFFMSSCRDTYTREGER